MRYCVYCGKEKKDIKPWLRVQTVSNPKVFMDICPECHGYYRQRLRGKEFKGLIKVIEGAL